MSIDSVNFFIMHICFVVTGAVRVYGDALKGERRIGCNKRPRVVGAGAYYSRIRNNFSEIYP